MNGINTSKVIENVDALQQRILLRQNKGTTCITFIPYDMSLPYALQKIFKKME